MKKIVPAKRMQNVKHANRDVVPIAEEVEKTGKKVLYLNIGDPLKFDFRTPKHMWKAIEENKKTAEGYANALGSDEARKAIADYAKRTTGKEITKEDVINFVGGSEAIIISLQALLNPGENVLLPRPGYSVYNGEMNFLGAEINQYDLDEEKNWEVDVESLRKNVNEKTKAIVVINPSNPTGGIISKKNLQTIIGVAAEHELPIISDETYDQIIFDEEEFIPMASLSKDVPVISLGGISKSYLASGFRGGWIYKHDPNRALDDYFEAIKKLCRLRLSNVGAAQLAIEAALNGPQKHIKDYVATLQKRRDYAFKRISEIEGLSCVKPKGAFYCFPKIEFPIESDKEFCLSLLKEKGVLVVFGSGFGQKEGTHHFRIVFLPPEETLNEAFDKIEEFIKEKYTKQKP